MAVAKYARPPVTLCAGYEWIDYANPSDPRNSFTDIAGNTLCLACGAFNNTDIVNNAFSAHQKIFEIFWVGAKYAVTDDLDVMAGYYEFLQNSYGAGPPCSDATKPTCSGMYNALSLALDWRLTAKLDAYAGVMYQTASAGLVVASCITTR
jgi:predicted porin